MKNIDFLPQRYRRDRAGRATLLWRIGGLSLLGSVLGCAWLFDASKARQLELELAEATQQFDQMTALVNQSSALDSQWVAVNAQAELWTYLRHPWPKTQILAALTDRLPEALWLDEVRIDRGEGAETTPIGLLRDASRGGQGIDAAADTRTAAQRDLARLQDACDTKPIVVLLRGVTTGMTELHAYLAAIGKAPLFSHADLVSLERQSPANHNVYRFVAKVTVKPAYGQLHGPTPPTMAAAVELTEHHPSAHAGANRGNQSR